MAAVKKETEMNQVLKFPPLPKSKKGERKVLRQAEINADLWEAVEKEMDRKQLSIRSILEWGLSAYLLASNPREAEKLGIKAE